MSIRTLLITGASLISLKNAGLQQVVLHGAEWAATGNVVEEESACTVKV